MYFLVDDRYVYHNDRYMTGTCVYDSLTCVCTCVSVTDKCTATRTVHMYTVHINTGREFMVHSVLICPSCQPPEKTRKLPNFGLKLMFSTHFILS